MNLTTRIILLASLIAAQAASAYVIKETKQDEDFSFYVNDGGVVTQALTLDGPTANVGIGIADPTNRLHVVDSQDATTTINMTNANSGVNARALISITSQSAGLSLQSLSEGYTGQTTWQDAGVISTPGASGGGLILAAGTNSIKFQAPVGTERMRIDSSTGKVAIGTSTLQNTKLVVENDSATSLATASNFVGYTSGLELYNPNTTANSGSVLKFISRNAGVGYSGIGGYSTSSNNAGLSFFVETADVILEAMRITPLGSYVMLSESTTPVTMELTTQRTFTSSSQNNWYLQGKATTVTDTPDANDMGGIKLYSDGWVNSTTTGSALAFFTRASAGGVTERLKIDNAGATTIGTTTAGPAVALTVQGSADNGELARFITPSGHTSGASGIGVVTIDTDTITSNVTASYAFLIDTQASNTTFVVNNAGRVGVGAVPLGGANEKLYLRDGAGSGGSAYAFAELIVDSDDTTANGIQILSPGTGTGRITFGDTAASSRAQIIYQHTTDAFSFTTGGTSSILGTDSALSFSATQDTSGHIRFPTGNAILSANEGLIINIDADTGQNDRAFSIHRDRAGISGGTQMFSVAENSATAGDITTTIGVNSASLAILNGFVRADDDAGISFGSTQAGFYALTSGTTESCTTACASGDSARGFQSNSGVCFAAWDNAGNPAPSACGTAATGQRCLCYGVD